jgi:hypothetical protein
MVLLLEGSFRSDRSSTLPKKTTDLIISQYLGFSFSNLIDAPWMSFGKAEQIMLKLVAPDPYNVFNTF